MSKSQNGKQRSNSSPGKSTALPRRNKAGKKPPPNLARRYGELVSASRRTGRRVTIFTDTGIPRRNPVGTTGVYVPVPKNYSRNPGAGPASVADMQARTRGNAPSIRKRKTSNYVKGRKSK